MTTLKLDKDPDNFISLIVLLLILLLAVVVMENC